VVRGEGVLRVWLVLNFKGERGGVVVMGGREFLAMGLLAVYEGETIASFDWGGGICRGGGFWGKKFRINLPRKEILF